MIHTDGTPTIANHGSEALLERPTASERIRAARENQADIRVENHGSIYLLRPLTDEGVAWLDENVEANGFGWGSAIACEPRFVFDVVTGAEADGLNVS